MPMPLWMREILGAFRSTKSDGRRVELGGQLFVRRMEDRRVLAAPVGVVDTYTVAEGGTLTTTDDTGATTPGNLNDDGVLANDVSDLGGAGRHGHRSAAWRPEHESRRHFYLYPRRIRYSD